MAAVDAVFASTHEAAQTLTVRQTSTAGTPLRGSTMWWTSPAAVRQRRTVVLDVARPPERIATVSPSASSCVRWSSATRIGQAPSGGLYMLYPAGRPKLPRIGKMP